MPAPPPPDPPPGAPSRPPPAGVGADAGDPTLRLQQTLAALSHDLKDPLTVIRAQAQLLARRFTHRLPADDAPRFAAGLERIQDQTRRLARWIDELSDAARLQLGESLPLDRLPVDLVVLARRVAAEQEAVADGHRIAVRAGAPAVSGHWDEARLERVLLNLIANAVKYSPPGSPVTVAVDVEPDAAPEMVPSPPSWATVRVSDRGIGIPAADLERVFQPYFRARNATPFAAGSGLGLFSVWHIVTRHGGTVAVDSREGAGTTVTVRLPLSGQPASAT